MKTTITFILFAMMTTSLLAENNNSTTGVSTGVSTGGYGSNGGTGNGQGARCVAKDEITNSAKERKGSTTDAGVEVPANPTKALISCEKLKIIAHLSDEPGGFETSDQSITMDGKVTCRQDGSYTVDYKDCSKVKNLYNAAILAEQAMFATQKIIVSEQNMKQQKAVAAAQAKGDTQYGAIEAVIAQNEFDEKMNKTQAYTYSTAVTALSAAMAGWDGKKSLIKACKKKSASISVAVKKEMELPEFNEATCTQAVQGYKSTPVFMNDDAKNRFIMEIGLLIQKAAEAVRRAGINDKVGERLKETAGKADEETTILDPCLGMNPPPECKGPGRGNIKPGSFAGGSSAFGGGAGTNQDFNMDPDGLGGIGDTTNPDGTTPDKVADIGSPFEASAKEASNMFDKAGAATTSPGSDPGAGGGGGGPGGGGGGSATLGDDLASAAGDEDGDGDIKTSKANGKYKAGGGGFTSVGKAGKGEGENPFASMFDAKGEEGGVEEDRSIASDDGEGSGLFHKISKKYGQVQQEKRVDYVNE